MRAHLEYILFRLVQSFSHILGPRRAYKAGTLVGYAGFRAMGARRRLARLNVRQAMPSLRPGTRPEEAVRASFEHFSGAVMESMASAGAVGRLIREGAVAFEHLDLLDRALARGRGAVAVIAHLGNWEVAGMAATQTGYPIVSVARPLHNPVLDRYFDVARRRSGQRIVSKRGSFHQLVRALRHNRVVIIPSDQWPKRGVEVQFLGRTTLALRSPALLALRCGAPILPINVYRAGSARPVHRVEITPAIEPEDFRNHADPVQAITQQIARRLEAFVREHPGQWMWMHDRWKSIVVARPARSNRVPVVRSGLR